MPSIYSPSSMTALEAVNLMLENAGEDPVATLDPASKPSAQKAERILGQESVDVQSQGWNFCTDWNLKLDPQPDIDNQIKAPFNLLSFAPTGTSKWRVLQQRGDLFYDAEASTFTFDGPIYIEAVLALPFDELPQPAKRFIAVKSALRFIRSETASQATSLRLDVEDLRDAKEKLDAYDNRLVVNNLKARSPHFRSR